VVDVTSVTTRGTPTQNRARSRFALPPTLPTVERAVQGSRRVSRDGTHKNTQGVWPCKLPLDSLPLQQLVLLPALMSCLSKQPHR